LFLPLFFFSSPSPAPNKHRRTEQKRDNADAKKLKGALVSFLEKAFYFKLHNLWFNINTICLRASRVGRTRWNMINRSDADRQTIIKEAKDRLVKLYEYVRDDNALREMQVTYEYYFNDAATKLQAFLRSQESWALFERWTTTLNIAADKYPDQFETDFFRFLEEIVDHWEEKNGLFKKAQMESKKEISKVVGNIEEQRSQIEELLAGETAQNSSVFSKLKAKDKIIIGVTAPIWIPIVVVAVPIVLVVFAVASFKEAMRKKAKREAYEKDRKRQKLEDTRELLNAINVEALTKKMFLSSENFMKQVTQDLAIRIVQDLKQVEQIEADEGNLAAIKKILESAMQIIEVVVSAVRTFYIENLRKDTIDKAKLKLNEMIGQGAFSKVYKGTYENKPVAIKVLITGDMATINAFFQEEEALHALRHPGILRFYGSYIETRPTGDREFYIVTALADGDLRAHLKVAHKKEERLIMIKELAGAIKYMHDSDYVHRDLKPENILVEGGSLKVADVGLTRKNIDITGTLAGTPLYMAPEILRHQYDVKVDVFSFGRIIWEVWFHESCDKHFPRNVDVLTAISKSFDLPQYLPGKDQPPKELAELFLNCCKVRKEERPTFKQICDTLDHIY